MIIHDRDLGKLENIFRNDPGKPAKLRKPESYLEDICDILEDVGYYK